MQRSTGPSGSGCWSGGHNSAGSRRRAPAPPTGHRRRLRTASHLGAFVASLAACWGCGSPAGLTLVAVDVPPADIDPADRPTLTVREVPAEGAQSPPGGRGSADGELLRRLEGDLFGVSDEGNSEPKAEPKPDPKPDPKVPAKPDPKPEPITAAEAVKSVGKDVVVRMKVASTGAATGGRMFLNSHEDRRDKDNFTIVIPATTVARLKAEGLPEPHPGLKGKFIQVKGKVTLFNDSPQIVVNQTSQIIVDD